MACKIHFRISTSPGAKLLILTSTLRVDMKFHAYYGESPRYNEEVISVHWDFFFMTWRFGGHKILFLALNWRTWVFRWLKITLFIIPQRFPTRVFLSRCVQFAGWCLSSARLMVKNGSEATPKIAWLQKMSRNLFPRPGVHFDRACMHELQRKTSSTRNHVAEVSHC